MFRNATDKLLESVHDYFAFSSQKMTIILISNLKAGQHDADSLLSLDLRAKRDAAICFLKICDKVKDFQLNCAEAIVL